VREGELQSGRLDAHAVPGGDLRDPLDPVDHLGRGLLILEVATAHEHARAVGAADDHAHALLARP
jgi:hypothetical protein